MARTWRSTKRRSSSSRISIVRRRWPCATAPLIWRSPDTAMADAVLMDRMFQRIMRGLVDTGRAPQYAELARALGVGIEQGRLLLHDVMRAYPIGWLHPETDYVASFPPLNNLPTQYRVTVRGEQRW